MFELAMSDLYLGHQISASGIKVGNENLKGIAEMAYPTIFMGI